MQNNRSDYYNTLIIMVVQKTNTLIISMIAFSMWQCVLFITTEYALMINLYSLVACEGKTAKTVIFRWAYVEVCRDMIIL